MIGWLQGQRLDNWKQSLKQGIVLACSGVGYEIQLLPRHLVLIRSIEAMTLWIHQVKRDDGENLYGFQTKKERDLFRLLIGVSGVGPQIGMALLEESQVDDLIGAIIDEDICTLSKAQGVGKRTAERLAIELRHKLSEFNYIENEISPVEGKDSGEIPLQGSYIKELHETLRALGYEDVEIRRALRATTNEVKSKENQGTPDLTAPFEVTEGLLKACLVWLSNESK